MQQAERKQWPKRRALIKPLTQTIDHQLSNIFQQPKTNPEHFQPQQLHHIVGDSEWKRTFYGEISNKNHKDASKEHSNSVSIAEGASKQSAPSHNEFAMTTQKSNQSRFCLDQIDKESRETRTLQKFAQTQKIWKKTERSILDRVERNNSISYTAVKNLYLHPNPDKLTLINDNVPQYWQHSLRDNKKELKKYLRDNPFKQEIAEEMLQTLAGRKRLEKSIPELHQPQQLILLKGRSIQEKKSWGTTRSKFFDQTYKTDFRFKDRWLNEVNCTQTISSLYSLN